MGSVTNECTTWLPIAALPYLRIGNVTRDREFVCHLTEKQNVLINAITSELFYITNNRAYRSPINNAKTVFLPHRLTKSANLPSTSTYLLAKIIDGSTAEKVLIPCSQIFMNVHGRTAVLASCVLNGETTYLGRDVRLEGERLSFHSDYSTLPYLHASIGLMFSSPVRIRALQMINKAMRLTNLSNRHAKQNAPLLIHTLLPDEDRMEIGFSEVPISEEAQDTIPELRNTALALLLGKYCPPYNFKRMEVFMRRSDRKLRWGTLSIHIRSR